MFGKSHLKGYSAYVTTINTMLAERKPDSFLYIIDNNIALDKLLHHPDSKFKENIDQDIDVQVFTWKKRKDIEDNIEELTEMGVRVFLTDPTEEHYAISYNKEKKFMWSERYHEENCKFARDCVYTEKPYDPIWTAIQAHFSKLKQESEELIMTPV